MGGMGSGRYAAGLEIAKQTVESKQHVDIKTFKSLLNKPEKTTRELAKDGKILGRTIVDPIEKYVRLIFGGYDFYIEIDSTECHYGGERHWFLCPSCETRRGKLYFNQEELECRECADLNYSSQQYNIRTDGTYYNRKAEKLGKKLDKNFKFFEVHRPIFPPKPKRMRTHKYMRMQWLYYHYMQKGTEKWLRGIRF